MATYKEFIKNRKDQRVAVVVRKASPQTGLAFVMHGLSGFKEQKHIEAIAQAFAAQDVTTVLFDTTNTFGESDGSYEDATTTNYYEDLEDVIGWAREQEWFQSSFVLSGHSLGGMSAILYTETHPEDILAVAAISPVVSGRLSVEAHERSDPAYVSHWKASGWKEEPSDSIPGVVKRLKWSHLQDRLQYDVLPKAKKLTMPALVVVGELDTSTPPDHVSILFDALPGEKTLHVIKGTPHTFKTAEHLDELKTTIVRWVEGILSGITERAI